MLNELTERVIKRFWEWVNGGRILDAEDAFEKILMQEIPRGIKELMRLASEHMFLATQVNCGAVLDDEVSPADLVYANLYDFLEGILWKEFYRCPACYGLGVLRAEGYPDKGCTRCDGSGAVNDG